MLTSLNNIKKLEKELIIKLFENNQELEELPIVIPAMEANNSLAITGLIKTEIENIYNYSIKSK